MIDDVSTKLRIALAAAAISRARLAADLGVDKSAVSRWCNGVHAPSDENLARITRLIAARVPRFDGLDWDRSTDELRRHLAADDDPVALRPDLFPGADAARREIERVGDAYCGHWDEWRPSFLRRGEFARDTVWIRRDGDFLAFSAVNGQMRSDGWFMPANGKATIIFKHRYSDAPGFIIVYTHEGERAMEMDGLGITVTLLASRLIAASPLIFTRAADRVADPAADEALFTARHANSRVALRRAAVPAELLPRLDLDLTDEWVLRVSADGSLAQASAAAAPVAP